MSVKRSCDICGANYCGDRISEFPSFAGDLPSGWKTIEITENESGYMNRIAKDICSSCLEKINIFTAAPEKLNQEDVSIISRVLRWISHEVKII